MIHWKDKTYCVRAAKGMCVNRDCGRYLDPNQDTGGLMVSMADFYSESCGYIESPVWTELKQATGGE